MPEPLKQPLKTYLFALLDDHSRRRTYVHNPTNRRWCALRNVAGGENLSCSLHMKLTIAFSLLLACTAHGRSERDPGGFQAGVLVEGVQG